MPDEFAQDEDTRDEAERFAETYAALDGDAEDEHPAGDDQAERGDDDLDEAADSQDADDDGDDDAPEAGDGDPAAEDEPDQLTGAKQALNKANSELGRLRPLREQMVRAQAEQASATARLEALTALLDSRDREIEGIWQQAYDQATDPTQRGYYAAELARRRDGFRSERERLDWQANQRGAEFQAQAQQALGVQELDRFVRENAQGEFGQIIAREAKSNGLGKEEIRTLQALANTREFQAILASAPPREVARFVQMKATELVETARTLGKGRARRNRTEVADKGTFRQEKPVASSPKGKPSQEQIARKYRNSGQMAEMYAEMQKHGYM